MIRWGEKAEWLEALAAEGIELPAWRDRTEPWFHLRWLIDAFNALSPSRQVTMNGEGAIPVSEVNAYCQMAGIVDTDDRLEFLDLIRAIDYGFLDERRKRADSEKEKEKPGGK